MVFFPLFWCEMYSFIIFLGKFFVLLERKRRRRMFRYTDEHVLCKMQNSICCNIASSCGIELLQQKLGLLYKNAQTCKVQTNCGRKLGGLYSLFLSCVFGIICSLGLLSFVKSLCALNGKKTVFVS